METILELFPPIGNSNQVKNPKSIKEQGQQVFNEIQVSYKKKTVGKIQTAEDGYTYLKPLYEDFVDLREAFIVLYLNRSNNIIGHFVASTGGVSGTVVDSKLIFATGLACLASSILLSHNHPSGNTKPSEQDLQITKKIKECGKLLDMPVLDHLILTSETYYSFANEGLL